MNGVDTGALGDPDDVRDIQIGRDRLLAGTDQIAFICLETVQREAILVGVDRDGAHAHFGSSTHDADGNFAAVGDQQLANRHVPC